VPPWALNLQASAKEVNHFLAQDCDNIILVNNDMMVTIFHWTHLHKGPIWCLASANGDDVSPLRWMGGQTYLGYPGLRSNSSYYPNIPLNFDAI